MKFLAVIFFASFVNLAEFKPLQRDINSSPVLLVRLKRTPNRAFTFSGFNPNTGLSAFATSADFFPSFYKYAQPPQPAQSSFSEREEYLPSSQGEPSYSYPPADIPTYTTIEEDRKFPAQNLTPPADTAPNTGYVAPSSSPAPINIAANAIQNPKKPKKKPNPVPTPAEEEEEEEDAKPRSSSSASFNAWFPIVLGSYPSKLTPESFKDESAPISTALKEKSASNVIANSVSNGRNGVASSHAIYYGGESPMQSYHRG